MGKRRSYTDDFKNDAVRLALENKNASLVARDLKMPERTLRGWVNLHKKQTSRS